MENYLEINQQSWDKRTPLHLESDFYNNHAFIEGAESLNEIEIPLLGDVSGKKILHLQCHFGQDTISLARRGAVATGVDLSPKAIEAAKTLNDKTGQSAQFIQSDVFALPEVLDEQFDLIFTSYGVLGWLPNMNRWAQTVSHFLKPGGELLLVEFHPFIWMYDDDLESIVYNYFKDKPIEEMEESSYTENSESLNAKCVTWNHGLSEVMTACLDHGLAISHFGEYGYSPYNCFSKMKQVGEKRFIVEKFNGHVPMVYSLKCTKQ